MPPLAERPSVVVLDNTDPEWNQDEPRFDGLRLLSQSGAELWAFEGFNSAQSVGGAHGVAIDLDRGRIFVRENVGNRIHAYEISGRRLWQIEQIEAGTLAVDAQTGFLWCSGGPGINQGETVVFGLDGNEIAAYPYIGVDMAYDPLTGGFWLVSEEILKLDRNGNVLSRKRLDGWCCTSVSVNPTDGSVWIGERDHPDVARSKNRLWLLNSDGSTKHVMDLGDLDPFVVECDPKSGAAWFAGYQTGLRRASPAGEFVGEPLDLNVRNIAISPTTGDLWVTTTDAVLRLDASGDILAEFKFDKPSEQSWIAAF
jgi:hypothetical protein